MPMQQPINDSCPGCTKTVFPNEAKLAAGVRWHPMCFKCGTCSKMLDSNTVAGHEGQVYCKHCYNKQFARHDGSGGDRPGIVIIKGPTVEGGCPRCGKRVYDAEKRTGGGRDWHKSCYRCKNCQRALDATGLNEAGGEIYCKNCYARMFGPVGKH